MSIESSSVIHGNATLLKEMMNNLIDNAIRYSYVGSKVIVGVKTKQNDLQFYVQDHGVGVAFNQQANIFERFYRTLDTDEEGCGLGLTIVKEIAHRHAGRVDCFSEGYNKGATFTVSFS